MRFATLLLAATLAVAPAAEARLERWLAGNAADVAPVLAGPALLLGGGGPDVDSALQALIDAVRGCSDCAAALDVVVLRASGSDAYNDYILAMRGVDSVETLLMTTRAEAGSRAVADTVRRAEIVFFAGGDQCRYVRLFRGTRLQAAVESVHARGGGVGGTSAGEAIQGEIVYDACVASATSAGILANPYARSATFTTGFFRWPPMAGTLTDQHFVTRDRMGRLLGFLARLQQDGIASGALLGVAADEQTSIVVDRAGLATVYGNGAGSGRAFFVLADHRPGSGERVQQGRSLVYRGFRIWQVNAGERYDLRARDTNGPPTRVIDVIDGRLSADPYGEPPPTAAPPPS